MEAKVSKLAEALLENPSTREQLYDVIWSRTGVGQVRQGDRLITVSRKPISSTDRNPNESNQ